MVTTFQRIDIRYRLTFRSSFHCGTGQGTGLLDRTVQRDADGYLRVPGSTVKGVLRHTCEDISALLDAGLRVRRGRTTPALRADSPHDERAAWHDFDPQVTLLARLFGSRVRPGPLFFDDAVLSQDWRETFDPFNVGAGRGPDQILQVEERTQVGLARLTGTARADHLYSSEYGPRGLTFEGAISGVLEDWPTFGSAALTVLLAGLCGVDRLGAQRSVGVGRCAFAVMSLAIGDARADPVTYLRRLDLDDVDRSIPQARGG